MKSCAKCILAIGDCITSGVRPCQGNSYPEQVGIALKVPVVNYGRAMLSTREGIAMLKEQDGDEFDCVFIQFGLKDAYTTFKYSPNILYYPDNFLRKQIRSIVKKYKKTCRRIGLNELLGEVNVISEKQYLLNISEMVEWCRTKQVVLPETIPHQETFRNPAIKRYNRILEDIAQTHDHCLFIKLYDDFLKHMPGYYLDTGHPNELGYTFIADKILKHLG